MEKLLSRGSQSTTVSDSTDPMASSAGEQSDGTGVRKTAWKFKGEDMVHNSHFERTVGVLVMFSTLMMGLETDSQWASRSDSSSLDASYGRFLAICESVFCIAFLAELTLRLLVDRMGFFTGQDWAWNLFDFVVVGIQVLEQISIVFGSQTEVDPNFLRTLNTLRVARITRMIRVVRLMEELRTILASIMSSMALLVWTCLLLMILLYATSLFFTQMVLNAGQTEHADKLAYWYGGVGRTYLTMFECIFGGVSWDEVVAPLSTDVSPVMAVAFCLYIAFCMLAMMNMATGVFVDSAMRKAQEDKDTNTANRITELFFDDIGEDETVSFQQFCKKIDTPEMQDYFRAINVDPSEAKGLYRLLDRDNSGAIDAEEMVSGCLRLRGAAKALEVSLLMHETLKMNKRNLVFQSRVERHLGMVCEALSLSTEHHDIRISTQTLSGLNEMPPAPPKLQVVREASEGHLKA